MILELQILSLTLFLSVFVAVTLRVIRRGAASYDRDARLPLEHDHER